MKLTNNYVNMMRYVSASSKKSIIETLKPTVKKGVQLKYTGPAEYKSIPIGMAQENNVFPYKQWEDIVLRGGETKSYAIGSWIDFFTPPPEVKLSRVGKEIKKCFEKENLNKIEFFKTLSPQERDFIAEYGRKTMMDDESKCISSDAKLMFSTILGYRPAWYCERGFDGKVDFSKIKLNPKIADKFDVVKLSDGGLYFLNKQEVLKIIEKNRDIYCAGQMLSPSENVYVIYNTLLKNLQNGFVEAGNTGEALFGITLGYPRHSCMIFELTNRINDANKLFDTNFSLFKEKLLELLNSNNSPFVGYPKEAVQRLEKHIKDMQSSEGIHTSILYCRIYGEETNAVNKIKKQSEKFNKTFKVEDLM